jgi:exosortase A-associated hydrolase 2
MLETTLEVRFEDFDGHRSVVVRWRPTQPPRARAVFFPAFGDEMNQTRRMVKLAAEALSEHGIESVVFDVHGTGDSSAGFEEATVQRWLADCRAIVSRAQDQAPAPLLLIGCRLGVALAVETSRALPEPAAALIGWAPVFQGKQQLSAILRADKVARMHKADAAQAAQARALWAAGRPAWLGGYPISAALTEELEALNATAPPNAVRATLIDVRVPVGHEPVVPIEPLKKHGDSWAADGVVTTVQAVPGAGFWNVADLVDVPELVEATLAAVDLALEPAE